MYDKMEQNTNFFAALVLGNKCTKLSTLSENNFNNRGDKTLSRTDQEAHLGEESYPGVPEALQAGGAAASRPACIDDTELFRYEWVGANLNWGRDRRSS